MLSLFGKLLTIRIDIVFRVIIHWICYSDSETVGGRPLSDSFHFNSLLLFDCFRFPYFSHFHYIIKEKNKNHESNDSDGSVGPINTITHEFCFFAFHYKQITECKSQINGANQVHYTHDCQYGDNYIPLETGINNLSHSFNQTNIFKSNYMNFKTRFYRNDSILYEMQSLFISVEMKSCSQNVIKYLLWKPISSIISIVFIKYQSFQTFVECLQNLM